MAAVALNGEVTVAALVRSLMSSTDVLEARFRFCSGATTSFRAIVAPRASRAAQKTRRRRTVHAQCNAREDPEL
ncbi:hypothetical protein QR680_005840 [Steinernema hermaphroditum]|uniref:Uncharacterized protein n=1 Tax=Steinernema hermaphroditum TaxID=289476 RepID=A0AA39HUU2_9BILA|nr:hypothetical protein QR680_005840 [Steinernema hermaphroditum]